MATRVAHPDRTGLNWLLVGSSLITLFFWTPLEDPFNAPKSWILYSVGLWLLGWIGVHSKDLWKLELDRVILILAGILTLSLSMAMFATDVKFQGLFGDYARRTGFLSYVFLLVFLLAAAFLFNFGNISNFDRVTLVVGSIVGMYGFLQHFKIDFTQWNNGYNSVISTLGNPDFAAAVMAIFVVLSLGLVLDNQKSLLVRTWSAINILILLVTIIFSQVRQGLLAGAIGVGVVVVVWVYQRQKIVAWVLVGLGLLGGAAGLIGMLKKGPLKGFFYKASVTYRGDYWRAGMRMFLHHPWFGVGLDRYGAYFRQYRDATQALRRGPDIISNNAHDVPIQLAATGGIFVLIAFLAITLLIAWRGILALRKTNGRNQIIVATFFGAWLAYQAQSLISIDNLGIAIWGWLLGGLVIALSKDLSTEVIRDETSSKKKINSKTPTGGKRSPHSSSLAQPLISAFMFTVGLAICIPLFLADSSLKDSRKYAKPTQATQQQYFQIVRKSLGYGFQDPHVKMSVADLLAQAGGVTESKANLLEILNGDPRSYDSLATLALIDEQTRNVSEAVGYRRKIASLDPWNYKNLLQLGEDLKNSGDKAGAKAIIAQIDAFASKTAEAATAHKDFGA
jgi:O-antigen ligase